VTDIDVPQRTLRDLSNAVKTVEDRVVCLQMPKVESPDRGDEDYSGVDAFLAEKMVADGRWDPADCGYEGGVTPRLARTVENGVRPLLGSLCGRALMTGDWRLQAFVVEIIGQHYDHIYRDLAPDVDAFLLWHALAGLVETCMESKYVALQLASLTLLHSILTTSQNSERGILVKRIPPKDVLSHTRRFAPSLFLHLGHSNARVAALAVDPPGSPSPSSRSPSPKGERYTTNSGHWRHVEGRLTACSRMVEVCGVPHILAAEGGYSVETMMDLARIGLHHHMQECRHAGVDLVVQLFSLVRNRLFVFMVLSSTPNGFQLQFCQSLCQYYKKVLRLSPYLRWVLLLDVTCPG